MFCEWVVVSIFLALSLVLHLFFVVVVVSGSIFELPIWLFVQCITFWNFLICAKKWIAKEKKQQKNNKIKMHKLVLLYRLTISDSEWNLKVEFLLTLIFAHNFLSCKTVSIRSHISSRRMAEWGYLSNYFIGFDHCRHSAKCISYFNT